MLVWRSLTPLCGMTAFCLAIVFQLSSMKCVLKIVLILFVFGQLVEVVSFNFKRSFVLVAAFKVTFCIS